MKYTAFAAKLSTVIFFGFLGYLTHVKIREVKNEQPMHVTKQTAAEFYGTVSGIVSELTIHPGNGYSFVLGKKTKVNAKGTPPDWLLDGETIKIDFRSASMELVDHL